MGSPVAAKLVGYESSRYPALTFQQFAEEALSRSTVSAALDQDVDRIAVLIHSSPQVVALTLDRDEEFIQVPGVAQTTLPSFQGSSVSRAEFATPLPNRLVGDNDTALSQQILDVAEAEGEPVIQPHGVADNQGWKAVAVVVRLTVHRGIVPDLNLTMPSGQREDRPGLAAFLKAARQGDVIVVWKGPFRPGKPGPTPLFPS